MALINCPECNKQISDKASNCPNCGYPICEYITQQEEIEQLKKQFLCKSCGFQNELGMNYCENCGMRISILRNTEKMNSNSFNLVEEDIADIKQKKNKNWFWQILILIVLILSWNSCTETDESEEDALQMHVDSETTENKQIEIVAIEEKILYDERNVKIYVKGIEKTSTGYDINIYIENNSNLNLGFYAHAYSINKIMTGNNIYSMNCDVAAGKRANTKIEIQEIFLGNYEIEKLKSIDILFWAYDNDKSYKEFDTGQITLETNLFDGNFDKIIGTNIYDKDGIRVDYLYNSGNEYTYCLTNNIGSYFDFDVENLTINDYTSSEIDYDLMGIIVLDTCQTIFTINVSDDFVSSNNISSVEKVEFNLNVRPMESYFDNWNTDMILLEL